MEGFKLWYIDGFAGTGMRTIDQRDADLFGEGSEPQEIDGSAKIALGIDPPFQRFIFIEKKPKRVKALKALAEGRTCDLLAYRRLAPHARRNHPTEEHLLPLFVALGAAGPNATAERLHSSTTYGVLRMDAYAFGTQLQPTEGKQS